MSLQAQSKAVEHSAYFWAIACRQFPEKLGTFSDLHPRVRFGLAGMTAGTANSERHEINLQMTMLEEEGSEAIRTTTGHEVAHIVDAVVNNDYHKARRRSGKSRDIHGPYWRDVMRRFGLQPETTHSYEAALRLKRSNRTEVYCSSDCDSEYFMTPKKWQRIKESTPAWHWYCRKCKAILTVDAK